MPNKMQVSPCTTADGVSPAPCLKGGGSSNTHMAFKPADNTLCPELFNWMLALFNDNSCCKAVARLSPICPVSCNAKQFQVEFESSNRTIEN